MLTIVDKKKRCKILWNKLNYYELGKLLTYIHTHTHTHTLIYIEGEEKLG